MKTEGMWPWKLESSKESCNNSPFEFNNAENGWRLILLPILYLRGKATNSRLSK